jgi:hypothetical protein
MLRIVLSALLTLIAVGCGGPRYVDYFPYHDDGTLKPKVALMPILDSSQCVLPWDFTEEISEGIYYELMNSGEFYVVAPKEMGPGWLKRDQINFFDNDYSYVNDFKNTDFIVAMEVMERSVLPCDPCTLAAKQCPDSHPSNRTLTWRIRIKIIDIRYCEPKVVLYEVFKTCYSATPGKDGTDGEICWKSEGYGKSYCGLGHQRLINTLTKRLEEVIWSAK